MNFTEDIVIDLPKWVITTDNNTEFYNRITNKFETKVLNDCLFNTPCEAMAELQKLDFGYFIKSADLFIS